MITSTRFVNMNDNAQFVSNRIMILRVEYQLTKKNVLIMKTIIRFDHLNTKSK